MLRVPVIAIICCALLTAGCTKNKAVDNNEAALYGAWVNSNLPTDTLWFMNKGGKNILRYNNSLNLTAPAYAEQEYFFKDGKLSIVLGGPLALTAS